MPLTIVAKITAAPGKASTLRAQLEALVAPTRAEAGCQQYDLHEDNTNPGLFLFYETWESRDHWQAHNGSPHIAAHREASKDTMADIALYEMTRIA